MKAGIKNGSTENLALELEHRVAQLIQDYDTALKQNASWSQMLAIGETFAKWFTSVFRVEMSTTPKGGLALKKLVEKFLWAVRHAVPQQGSTALIRSDWDILKSQVPDLVAKFSDEGGTEVLREMTTSVATYLNLRGIPTPLFKKYVQSLEAIFGSLHGWRIKALAGNFKVALAGPDQFRGTAKGKYSAEKDTLFVRATPDVMKRTGGRYASPEYILVHEVAHRYEKKIGLHLDFDRQEWHTTPYSMTESMAGSESFAELFALGHFGITSYRVLQFGDKVERFEQVMAGKTSKKSSLMLPLGGQVYKVLDQGQGSIWTVADSQTKEKYTAYFYRLPGGNGLTSPSQAKWVSLEPMGEGDTLRFPWKAPWLTKQVNFLESPRNELGHRELGHLTAQAPLTKLGAMPRIQYHATSWDRVPSIMAKGLQLPRGHHDVSTFLHGVPSISTADKPEDARIYHPDGALLEVKVKPGFKYLTRSPRQMKRGETLVQAVDRWAAEVQEKGAAGFWMDGWQSTVGNQTYEPKALEVLRVLNPEDAPSGKKGSVRMPILYRGINQHNPKYTGFNWHAQLYATPDLMTASVYAGFDGEVLRVRLPSRLQVTSAESPLVRDIEMAPNRAKRALELGVEAIWNESSMTVGNVHPYEFILFSKVPIKYTALSKSEQEDSTRFQSYLKVAGKHKDATVQELVLQVMQDGVRPSRLKQAALLAINATKSPAEKEDEEVERLVRKSPKNKPKRQDLRRERIKEDDEDTEYQGADKDRDLSLNSKRVAARWLEAKINVLEPVKSEGGKKVWKTEKGWRARNPAGNEQSFDKLDKATAFSQGKDPAAEEEPSGESKPSKEEPKEESGSKGKEIPEGAKSKLQDFVALSDKDWEDFDAFIKTMPPASDEDWENLIGLVKDSPLSPEDDALAVLKDFVGEAAQGEKEAPEKEKKGIPDELLEDPEDEGSKTQVSYNQFQELLPDLAADVEDAQKDQLEELLDPLSEEDRTQILQDLAETKPADVDSAVAGLKGLVAEVSGEEKLDRLVRGLKPRKFEELIEQLAPAFKSKGKLGMQDEMTTDDPEVKKLLDDAGVPEGIFKTVGDVRDFLHDKASFRKLVGKPKPEEEAKPEPEDDSKPEAEPETEDSKAKAKFDKTMSELRELSPELAQLVQGSAEHPTKEDFQKQVLESYSMELKDLQKENLQGEAKIKFANGASDPNKLKGSKNEPIKLGAQLAAYHFAHQVIANPSLVGGKEVSDTAKTSTESHARAIESFEQYSKLNTELRHSAAKSIVAQMTEAEENSPRRQELARILDGLSMAAMLKGEDLNTEGAPVRSPPSPAFRVLAKSMQASGRIHELLKPIDALESPDGRSLIQDVVKSLPKEEVYDLVGGRSGQYKEWIKDIESGDMHEDTKAILISLMGSSVVNRMTIGHACFVSGARRSNPKKTIEQILEDCHNEVDRNSAKTLKEILATAKQCKTDSTEPAASTQCTDALNKAKQDLIVSQLKSYLKIRAARFGKIPGDDPVAAQMRFVIETGDLSELEKKWIRQAQGKPEPEDSDEVENDSSLEDAESSVEEAAASSPLSTVLYPSTEDSGKEEDKRQDQEQARLKKEMLKLKKQLKQVQKKVPGAKEKDFETEEDDFDLGSEPDFSSGYDSGSSYDSDDED